MTCSKIFSGDLPELLNEIMLYFRNDFKTLHSCILVNRLWCRSAIPLLWEDPFSIPTENYHFIEICLNNLNDDDKTKLTNYGFNHNLLFPSKTLFNYPSFIKCLNTWKIFYFIEKWVTSSRPLTTEEQQQTVRRHSIQNAPSYPSFDQNLNSDQVKNMSRLIYEALLKIGSQVNLHTFEVTTIRGMDHDYFDGAFELILQNPNLIRNLKNLKLSFNGKITNLICDFLKFLYTNCNSISTLYFHFKINYDDDDDDLMIKEHSSRIITSQQNLEKILFGFYLHDTVFSSLKNLNCSNTLKTVIFYKINFKNMINLKQVFDQLNVLESIHLLYCSFLNIDIIQQIISITKPFKLTSLFVKEKFQIEQFQLLLQKSGDYLENIGFSTNLNKSKQKMIKMIELITKYCKKIKFFDLPGFDVQNIYSVLDLIKNFEHNLNYLSINFNNPYIFDQSNDEIIKLSSIILQGLGQNLPLKLEYLDLSLTINSSSFEEFLKNSQNTFIKKLLIKNKVQEGSKDNILPLIKEYIKKKKRVNYLAFIMEEDSTKKSTDLFSLKDEVKKFELYSVKVQSYDVLKIQHYNYIEEMY